MISYTYYPTHAHTCTYMVQTYSIYYTDSMVKATVWWHTCTYISIKVTIQYSNYSIVSYSNYSSSIIVLTVIAVHVNWTPQ